MSRDRKTGKAAALVEVKQVKAVLAEYARCHPEAQVDVKSQNPVSIRIRILDRDFEGTSRSDREPEVWKTLKKLPEDVFQNITMLLLLTPEEAETSLANREFEDPIPSRL